MAHTPLACGIVLILVTGSSCGAPPTQFGALAGTASVRFDLKVDVAALEAAFQHASDGPSHWSMPTPDGALVDSTLEQLRILQPAGEVPLPFSRFRAISTDGRYETRVVRWGTQTRIFYISESGIAKGPLEGDQFRLEQLQSERQFTPCLVTRTDDGPTGPDPFGSGGVFHSQQFQLPPRTARVVFVPTDDFIADISSGGVVSTESRLDVLWMALRNFNEAAGLLHRELNIELDPVLSRDFVPTGPEWQPSANAANFDLIRKAVQKFCPSCTYDIGHALVGTNARGWGRLAKACDASDRVAGYSPNGKPAVIAHELAHQLGAFHTFNQGVAWHPEAAVEPAVGATVMVDLIKHFYFHSWSSAEVVRYLASPACETFGQVGLSSNKLPTFLNPPLQIEAPPKTPLRFDLAASDPDGDHLRMRCEGIDRAITEGAVPPVFASSADVVDGAVVIPTGPEILAGEVPGSSAGQSLRVVCTARDHRGGIAFAPIFVHIAHSEPFRIQATVGNAPDDPVAVSWTQPGNIPEPVSTDTFRLQLISDTEEVVAWVPTVTGGNFAGKLPAALKPGKWRVWVQPSGKAYFAVSEPFTVH